jgi:hypothetical protein
MALSVALEMSPGVGKNLASVWCAMEGMDSFLKLDWAEIFILFSESTPSDQPRW